MRLFGSTSSFLSDVKSLMGEDKGGRFLSAALRATCTHVPELAAAAFGCVVDDETEFTCEWSFSGSSQSRRCDLAVLRRGLPVYLVEVKYRDHKGAGLSAQTDDYLLCARQHVAGFCVLTEFPLDPPETARIKAAGGTVRRYHELYDAIARVRTSDPAKQGALAVLKEFLAAEVCVYDAAVSDDDVQLLTARGTGLFRGDGSGKTAAREIVVGAPQTLHRVLRNLEWGASRVQERMQIRHRAHLAFQFNQRVASNFSADYDTQDGDGYLSEEFAGKRITGGRLWCTAQLSLPKPTNCSFLRLTLGLRFILDRTSGRLCMRKELGAVLWGARLERTQKWVEFAHWPADDRFQAQLLKCSADSLREALTTRAVLAPDRPSLNVFLERLSDGVRK